MNLKSFQDEMARATFGITKSEAHAKKICIDCKQTPNLGKIIDEREYRISGLCNVCFERITKNQENYDH